MAIRLTPLRARVLRIALTLVMLALLVLYARTVRWADAWAVIRHASLLLLAAATLVNLVTLLAKALIWWLFLRAGGIRSLPLSIRATVVGAGLNNLLIGNGGDAARLVLVTRAARASSAAVLAALALERIFDLLGYMLLIVGAAFLLPMPEAVARWRLPAAGAVVVFAALFGILLWRTPTEAADTVVVAAQTTGVHLLGRIRRYLRRVLESIRAMVTLPRAAIALALTAVNWATQIACYHWTARAVGLPITVPGSIATLITANVGFAVRVTPGNVGIFQLVYAVTAQALGLRRTTAIAAALLIQIIQNVPVTVLAVILAPDLVLHRQRRRDAGATPSGTH